MSAGDIPDHVRAESALGLALWRRFLSHQILAGAADPMEISRLISGAALDAIEETPSIPASAIETQAHRLKAHIDAAANSMFD